MKIEVGTKLTKWTRTGWVRGVVTELKDAGHGLMFAVVEWKDDRTTSLLQTSESLIEPARIAELETETAALRQELTMLRANMERLRELEGNTIPKLKRDFLRAAVNEMRTRLKRGHRALADRD